MNNDLEIFNFSLKNLETIVSSLEQLNAGLDVDLRNKNNIMIEYIKDNINGLFTNILNKDVQKNDNTNLDYVTKILRDTIKNECERIHRFNSYIDLSDESSFVLIKEYRNQIYNLIEQVKNQINSLDLSTLKNNNVASIVNDKINEDKIQLTLIKEETDELIKMNLHDLFDSNNLESYFNFIKTKIDKSKNIIYEVRAFKENNKNDLTLEDNYVIESFINVIDNQIYTLNNLNTNLEKLLDYDIDFLENKNEELKKSEDYKSSLIKTFETLYNNNASDQEIISALLKLYNEEHIDEDEKVEQFIEEETIDEEQKEIDTKRYKENYSALNKSFWEARAFVAQEGVKYPSALYEKKVKEYQNNYLIEKYNISLDGLEREINEYKEKYAFDLYMDKIYEEAMYALKEETLSTIDEICDESMGLSILDCRVLDILNDDLMDVVRELRKAKEEECMDGFIDVEEYRKSIKLSGLIDKKEMIERQIFIMQNRKNKLEGLD